MLTGRDTSQVEARLATGRHALQVLEDHLTGRSYAVGGRITIADVALFPYVSVAGDAGVDLAAYPRVSAWIARIRTLPGFVDDFVTYPENARPEIARSIY